MVSDSQISLGHDVVESLLADSSLNLRAGAWWYEPEASEWRFLVATPFIDRAGPQAAYEKVRARLKADKLLQRLPLRRVWVVSDLHPIVEAARGVFGAPGRTEIVLSECYVGTLPIVGACFLLLEKKLAGTRKKIG